MQKQNGRANVRDIILKELASKARTWSQLLRVVREERMISQSAFYYHLTKLLQDAKIKKITRSGLRIYELAETEEALAKVAPKVAEIGVVDSEDLSYILNVISQAQSDEAKIEAFKDLKSIIKTKSVSSHPKIWRFFGNTLEDKNYERYWINLIACLRLILENAKANNDRRTISRLKKDLLPRILKIAKTPTRARWESVGFIDDLLPNEEKFEELKEIAEKVMKQKDEVGMLYPLAKMYTTRKREIWHWLYPLIDGDDPEVRVKASELLSYLRQTAKSF